MTDASVPRRASCARETYETRVVAEVDLDGVGRAEIRTGLGFLDHMLVTLAKHSGVDITLECRGDRHVDDHHSVEDCAIVLGTALDRALADRAGIGRFGWAYAPLDESLARVVLDLSGRPSSTIELGLTREMLGDVSCENIPHFFRSLAFTLRASLHVDVLRGENDHHRVEASFKALALALRQANTRAAGGGVPSTKGVLV